MKLNKVYRPPSFWGWVSKNLPASLEAREIPYGYGVCCNIYRKGEAPNGFTKHFTNGDPIATVIDRNELRLNFPEYFSDFEDMLKRFEAQTGIEPTLTFWASPKDEPK